MRELLLHNGKPALKTIIALALPAVIISLCGMYNMLEGVTYRGFDTDYTLRYAVEALLAPFITLFAWSLALNVINPPNKVLDIVIPAGAVALTWIVFRFLLNRTYEIGEPRSFQYIMYFAWPFVSYALFILITNALLSIFKNKIRAYVLAVGIQQIVSMTWLYLMQPEFKSVGLIFTQIPEVIIQFFLTVYFFKLMHVPYKAFTPTKLRKNELQQNIKEALANNTARGQLLDLLRLQFPDLSQTDIIRAINNTPSPYDMQSARTINNIIIVVLSLTCLPFIVLFLTQFPNRIDFSFGGQNLITSLLLVVLLVFICIRLYLLGSLLEYRSHAYIVLSILAGFGILAHLVSMALLKYFSAEFITLNIIGIGCNILALIASVTVYRRLYSGYRL